MAIPDYPRLPPSYTFDQSRAASTSTSVDFKKGERSTELVLRAACALTLAAHAGEDVYAIRIGDQEVQGEVDRSTSVGSFVEAMAGRQRGGAAPRLEVVYDSSSEGQQTSPLLLVATESPSALSLTLSVDSALLPALEARWLLSHIEHIFLQLLDTPFQTPLSPLELLPPDERQVLAAYSTSAPPPEAYPSSLTTLPSFFLHTASLYPSDPALQFDDLVLSYSQLLHLARFLAADLLPSIKLGQVVPICIEKSPEMIISMLAVLLVGGAYLNLEPSFPEGRKRGILQELAGQGMLAEVAVVQRKDGEKEMWNNWKLLDEVVDPELKLRPLLANPETMEQESPVPTVDWPTLREEDPAYVIYTSGTTGVPKGICVEHRNVAAFLRNYRDVFGRARGERVLQFPSYSFDVSVMNIWDCFAHGSTLCMTSPSSLMSDLAGTILRLGCTLVDLTPTISSLLFEHLDARPREGETVRQGWERAGFKIKVINTGGEKVEKWVRDAWMERGVKVVIDYGPTETTVGVISNQSTAISPPSVPIGRPTGSTTIYILATGSLDVVPLGCIGEICVGGAQVTRGYIKQNLNEGVFVNGGEMGRIYRTGDLGRFLGDGEGSIECLGRKDGQVKVNGLRIEIGEIEEHLTSRAHEALIRGVVDKLETPDIPASLVAFLDISPTFLPPSSSPATSSDLVVLPSSASPEFLALVEQAKSHLAASLPAYMVPRYWLPVNRIPTQGMGKTDRKSLRLLAEAHDWRKARSQSRAQAAKGSSSSSKTDDEWHAAARRAWARVLRMEEEEIADEDAFTRLGGDSIGFLKVVGKLRAEGYRVSFKELVDAATLAECAQVLKATSAASNEDSTTPPPPPYKPYSLLPVDDLPYIFAELDSELSIPASSIADIYPTAPSQDSLLAASQDSTHYYAQAIYALDSSLPIAVVEQALKMMVARYPVLRSCFAVLESASETVQIVLREDSQQVRKALEVKRVNVEDEKLGEALDAWLKEDREAHVFRWGRLALTFAVFATPSGQHKLGWSMHHAMSDGWTLELLSADLRALCHQLAITPRPNFSSVVAWWLAEPHASSSTADFWRSYLTGATPLHWPSQESLNGEQLSTSTTEILHWSGDLVGLSKRNGLTPAIASRIAIAVALGHHGLSKDVTLGIVRSGRDIDVDSADEVIGPCVSVLPSRLLLDPSISLLDLTREEATADRRARAHQHVTLAQLAKICDLPGRSDLFDILVTYQSLAEREEEPEGHRELAWPIQQPPERITMPTSYTLSLEITPEADDEEALELSCFYDHRIIEREEVKRLLGTIARVMDYITTVPCTKLGDLKLEGGGKALEPIRRATVQEVNGAEVSEKEVVEVVQRLAEVWASVLRLDIEEFGAEDSFASLGGDSISMMRLSVRLAKAELPIAVQALTKLPTMGEQARWLVQRRA